LAGRGLAADGSEGTPVYTANIEKAVAIIRNRIDPVAKRLDKIDPAFVAGHVSATEETARSVERRIPDIDEVTRRISGVSRDEGTACAACAAAEGPIHQSTDLNRVMEAFLGDVRCALRAASWSPGWKGPVPEKGGPFFCTAAFRYTTERR